MVTTSLRSSDLPVIPRGIAARFVGGPAVVEAAQRDGVLSLHRTATGHSYMTPRQFDKLVQFAQSYAK